MMRAAGGGAAAVCAERSRGDLATECGRRGTDKQRREATISTENWTPAEGGSDAQVDLLDDRVAGRLHRWAGRRDRLVGARRGAVPVPHPAGAGDRRAALRTAALRNDALLGDRAGDFAARGARRVRPDLEGPA